MRHSILTHDAGVVKVTIDEITDSDDDVAVGAGTGDDGAASADAAAAAAAEQAAAAAQFAAFAAQQAAAARAQQAAYRAALPFPADIGRDIDDVRAHVMRLLQPVGYVARADHAIDSLKRAL